MMVTACTTGRQVYMFTSFHEPATEGLRFLYSDDGYHWKETNGTFLKPEVGEKVMRDPSIVRGADGTFHLVWTSGWKGDRGFGYASSRDLIHWSPQRSIPVMEHEPSAVNVWAPELYYNTGNKEFIIIWASTVPFRFPKGAEEEENNHRMYYTTTKDFSTFSQTRLFFEPGFSVIDAIITERGKDDYVLVLKDNTRPNRNLKVAFSQDALGPYTNVSPAFTASFTEGPAVTHVGTDWLIYFDAYKDKRYGAVKTTDFKVFTDVSDKISIPEGHKHGTIFKVSRPVLKRLLRAAGH